MSIILWWWCNVHHLLHVLIYVGFTNFRLQHIFGSRQEMKFSGEREEVHSKTSPRICFKQALEHSFSNHQKSFKSTFQTNLLRTGSVQYSTWRETRWTTIDVAVEKQLSWHCLMVQSCSTTLSRQHMMCQLETALFQYRGIYFCFAASLAGQIAF